MMQGRISTFIAGCLLTGLICCDLTWAEDPDCESLTFLDDAAAACITPRLGTITAITTEICKEVGECLEPFVKCLHKDCGLGRDWDRLKKGANDFIALVPGVTDKVKEECAAYLNKGQSPSGNKEIILVMVILSTILVKYIN